MPTKRGLLSDHRGLLIAKIPREFAVGLSPLVRFAPVNELLGRLSAAYTLV